MEWVNDGAAVRVSLISFAGKSHQQVAELDGLSVQTINPDLTRLALT